MFQKILYGSVFNLDLLFDVIMAIADEEAVFNRRILDPLRGVSRLVKPCCTSSLNPPYPVKLPYKKFTVCNMFNEMDPLVKHHLRSGFFAARDEMKMNRRPFLA